MPTNPFGQADPLAGGGGTGLWGAGAAGFGQVQQAAPAVPGDEYDEAEITEDQPAVAHASKGPKAGKKGSTAKGIAAREAELAKREQELRRKEAALASAGGTVDHRIIANFPPCLPMVHHDINNDIPDYNKAIMRAGFIIFMLTLAALIWNFGAVLIGTIVSSEVTVASCFFAALYMVIGVPGAWYTWYGRLYAAMQTDGALSFAGFFFTFFIHTTFSIWSAVAPDLVNGQDFAHAGWLPALSLFKGGVSGPGNKFSGIMYMIGAGLWSTVSFFSVTYMARVYNKMRGGNLSERARQEAIQLGAQMAAQEMTRKNQTGRS